MATVEVDEKDLETLIFATAAIKQIEQALAQRNHDPFVRLHLDYSAAHDRLVAAWRSAQRAKAGTAVDWDGDLTEVEASFLIAIKKAEFCYEVTGDFRLKNKAIDDLASKGCVQIGQRTTGVVWSGEARPDLRPLPNFGVRITQRGIDK